MAQRELQPQDWANKRAVIVGVNGETGTRLQDAMRRKLGIESIAGYDVETPIRKIQRAVANSEIAVLAVPEAATMRVLGPARKDLGAGNLITEFGSTKGRVTPLLEELDQSGVRVGSVHIGIKTDASWAGAKVWLFRVGPNSDTALEFLHQLFSHFKSNIIEEDLRDHSQIQEGQVQTFVGQLSSAGALRRRETTIPAWARLGTANADLAAYSTARGLGQNAETIAEILTGQQDTVIGVIDDRIAALLELKGALSDRAELEEYIAGLQVFHGGLNGVLGEMFGDAGLLIAERQNTGLYGIEVNTKDNSPGSLGRILRPFSENKVSLTAVGSRQVAPSKQVIRQGADATQGHPAFKFGVDPETIDPQREATIREELERMGCEVKE